MNAEKKVVFLDTCVFPQTPHGNQDSRELAALVEGNVIAIHTSTIVAREWATKREMEFKTMADTALKAVQDIGRHPWAQEIAGFKGIEKSMEPVPGGTVQASEKQCKKFFESLNLQIEEIAKDASDRVFTAYFKGASPFTERKFRKDIPDAFILESLRLLASKVPVLAVLGDKKLAKAAGELENVEVFTNVKELTKKLAIIMHVPESLDTLLSILRGNPAALKAELSGLVDAQLSGLDMIHSVFPSRGKVARITGPVDIQNVKFKWDGAVDFGDKWVAIPFTFTVTLEVDVLIDPARSTKNLEWLEFSARETAAGYLLYGSGERDFCFYGHVSVRFTQDEIERQSPPSDVVLGELASVDPDSQPFDCSLLANS